MDGRATIRKAGDRIPTRGECDALMAEHAMLPNIVAHPMRVMRVSLAIVDHLKPGVEVNRDLIAAAALLHDITKTRSLETKERHDASGGALLRERGFASTAEIVEQHVMVQDLNPDGRLEEREIVCYADKRVLHDAIVSIGERVRDLVLRYGLSEEVRDRILQGEDRALALERKIARFMDIDLQDVVREAQDEEAPPGGGGGADGHAGVGKPTGGA